MKFFIAFDNSEGAKKALKFAMKFKPIADEYVICYISPLIIGAGPTYGSYTPPTVFSKSDNASQEVLNSAKELIETENVNASFLGLEASGDQIARVMTNAALERGADVIITGTRKLSGLSKVFLGSISSEIVKLSTLPVLVIPPG